MSTDFEQDLRLSLGSAEPPTSAMPELSVVLDQGNRAVRRQTVRRAVVGTAAVAAVAIASATWWPTSGLKADQLPGASTPATGVIPLQPFTAGDPVGITTVTGSFDVQRRILTITVGGEDPAVTPTTMPTITVPDVVTAPIVSVAPGRPDVITVLPAEATDIDVDATPKMRHAGTLGAAQGAPALGFTVTYTGLYGPAQSATAVHSVSWRTSSGQRISTLGDRVDPVTVRLADGRAAQLWLLDKAGLLSLSGPEEGSFSTMRLADAVDSLPGFYFGRGTGPEAQLSWFAAYLLPAGATDPTVTYLDGFTPTTAMILTPAPGGRTFAVLDLGATTKDVKPIRSFTWRDAAGVVHTEKS
ncbi:MAG: hypothetical protein U0Q14_09215 [Dermatophilaceae bacterium]